VFTYCLPSFGYSQDGILVRFQVLTAMSTKMAVVCDVAPCSMLDIDQCFRGS
jgi:hypothetical protein